MDAAGVKQGMEPVPARGTGPIFPDIDGFDVQAFQKRDIGWGIVHGDGDGEDLGNASKTGDDFQPLRLGKEGRATFGVRHQDIRGDSHGQVLAAGCGGLEIAQVADVKQIKGTGSKAGCEKGFGRWGEGHNGSILLELFKKQF
jgi:hypothetical protein